MLVNATISAIESLNDPRSLVPFAAVSCSLLTLDASDDDPMPVVIHISYGSIFNATFTCGHARKKVPRLEIDARLLAGLLIFAACASPFYHWLLPWLYTLFLDDEVQVSKR